MRKTIFIIMMLMMVGSVSALYTWDDLTSTDSNGYLNNCTIGLGSVGMVTVNNDVYFMCQTNTTSGIMLKYDSASNTTDKVSDDVIMSQYTVIPIYDGQDLIYTSIRLNSSISMFYTFNITNNAWTNLDATDTDNWVGTSGITSLTYDSVNQKIYTGLQSQKFGVYDIATGIWYNLTGTDLNDWILNTSSIGGLCMLDGNVFIGTSNAQVGIFNTTTNTSTRLNTFTGNNAGLYCADGNLYIPNAGQPLEYNPYTNTSITLFVASGFPRPYFQKVGDMLYMATGYTSSPFTKFYMHNLTSNVTDRLENYNMTGWVLNSAVSNGMTYDYTNNKLYTLLGNNNNLVLGVAYTYELSCTEDWVSNNTECNGYNYTKLYYDNASCGTYFNVPVDNGTIVDCYCAEDWRATLTECTNNLVTLVYVDDAQCNNTLTLPEENGTSQVCDVTNNYITGDAVLTTKTFTSISLIIILVFIIGGLIAILVFRIKQL